MLRTKLIITSLPDKNKIPTEIKNAWNDMLKNNKNYELRVFDNNDLEYIMKNEFPEYKKYWDQIRTEYYVAKVDLFRVLYIYKYGGIWLDAKIVLKRKLNSMGDNFLFARDKRCVRNINSNAGNVGSVSNAAFGFTKNHIFLKLCIEYITKRLDNYKKWYSIIPADMIPRGRTQILNVTGPGVFRDVLCNNKNIIKNNNINLYQQYSDAIVWSVFEPHIKVFWNLKRYHRKILDIETDYDDLPLLYGIEYNSHNSYNSYNSYKLQ